MSKAIRFGLAASLGLASAGAWAGENELPRDEMDDRGASSSYEGTSTLSGAFLLTNGGPLAPSATDDDYGSATYQASTATALSVGKAEPAK